jgi:2-dehydropantoate 2-reductase
MRFAVFGLGAIGTYIGVSLSKAGHEVIFIERPGLAGLDSLTLQLMVKDQTMTIAHPVIVNSLDQAAQIGSIDVAVVAVKGFDTPALADQLAQNCAGFCAVMSLQNGVENDAVLAQACGAEKIIAATLTSAVGRRNLGNVVLERKRGIGITRGHALSDGLFRALSAADLNPRLYESAKSMKWSKMLTNLLVNASSAILDMTPAEILKNPALYDLEVRQIREALAVMQANHYPVVDLPGTPVKAEAFLFGRIPPSLSRPIVSQAIIGGRGAKMPSFHIDLAAGRKQLEVDYLNGAVARAAQAAGLSAPVNAGYNLILQEIAVGIRPWEQYQHHPERLIAEINR